MIDAPAPTLETLPYKVIAYDIERGSQVTSGGIMLGDDNGKVIGIRPRWLRVYSVGEYVKDIRPGDWILVEHGRWSRTVEYYGLQLQEVEPCSILAKSTSVEKPDFRSIGRE